MDGWLSFVPVAFNMIASADLNKHIMGASGTVKRKSGYRRCQEAVCHKPDASMAIIGSALKAGIRASYILMDTCFTKEPFINNILGEGLGVIGMLKDNKQLYLYHDKLYNLKALSKLVAFNRAGDIFGSITVTTKNFNIPHETCICQEQEQNG